MTEKEVEWGAKLLCVASHGRTWLTKGKVYDCKGPGYRPGLVLVKPCDNGRLGGFTLDHFELAEPEKAND